MPGQGQVERAKTSHTSSWLVAGCGIGLSNTQAEDGGFRVGWAGPTRGSAREALTFMMRFDELGGDRPNFASVPFTSSTLIVVAFSALLSTSSWIDHIDRGNDIAQLKYELHRVASRSGPDFNALDPLRRSCELWRPSFFPQGTRHRHRKPSAHQIRCDTVTQGDHCESA